MIKSARYTTITIKHEVLHLLEEIEKELGAKSLGEAIVLLIRLFSDFLAFK